MLCGGIFLDCFVPRNDGREWNPSPTKQHLIFIKVTVRWVCMSGNNNDFKLWNGLSDGVLDDKTHDFNSSILFDYKMVFHDIKGSVAHAKMLGAAGIIDIAESEKIVFGLNSIEKDLKSGELLIDFSAEDIHTFIEAELTRRIGDSGKRLHTARSRNDQVALDLRLYLVEKCDEVELLLFKVLDVFLKKAEMNVDAVMPGYTHLQRAQPVTFAHHLLAYCSMLLRDVDRLRDCRRRMAVFPLGCGALAGTTYPIDREMTAELLSFPSICHNSIDGVSDRDFVIELASVLSIIMVHLSRFCEEIILWCSHEFRFITLDSAYCTGSSIMPQKKNPDIAELVRGKSGRVFGSLFSILTMMKGLPLAYNKDMQEDKEQIFDSVDTVIACLTALTPMVSTMTVNRENMRNAAAEGFINATDCADYLVIKGMPFRDAYRIVGKIIGFCIENGMTLESLPVSKYREYSELFDEDVYDVVDLGNCVDRRNSVGGPGRAAVLNEIGRIKELLK